MSTGVADDVTGCLVFGVSIGTSIMAIISKVEMLFALLGPPP